MALYSVMLANSFKTKAAFKFDYIAGTIFSFLYIVLKITIWKGLYGNNGTAINGISLSDMIAYSIISSFTQGVTKSTVMNDINDMVLNGNISIQLLLPLGFKKHMLLSGFTDNIFWVIYQTVPPVLISILIYGISFQFSIVNFLFYILALMFGFLINFLYSFVLGLSVLWLRNSFFLSNLNSLLPKLFSGTLVPIWFFPDWMNLLGTFLPFKYIVFEPIAVLLNKKSGQEILYVFLAQLFWIVLLLILSELVWARGKKRLMVQGG